jgi:catechol 2,3-dioxygenase-like lactoylglutathione lyase family enzyme
VRCQDLVSVRYIVDDVDAAIEFYTKVLDFKVEMHPAKEFAILSRENLRLLLSEPSGKGGGGQAMPDGTVQTPGGWNRFEIEVEDIESIVEKLKKAGCRFRNAIVKRSRGQADTTRRPFGEPYRTLSVFPRMETIEQNGNFLV